MNHVTKYLTELFSLTAEMSPYLLLGFLIAGVLHVWFPRKKIVQYMGSGSLRSVVNAALLGIPLPLCSCGVIPTGISFNKNGASKSATVSFLISTPQTGVDSILITYSLLNLPFALFRVLVALVTGVFGGLLTTKLNAQEEKTATATTTKEITEEDNRSIKQKISEMFRFAFFEFMQDIAKWLVIGLMIAALIAVVVPDNFFELYIGNKMLSMLLSLVAAIPLYVCATGSVPIAAVLIAKGLSPGAALVFLMAGPATNAATMTVIGNSMGRKTLVAYLTSIIIGALAFGSIIDYALPAEWFAIAKGDGVHTHSVLPEWVNTVSAIIFSALVAIALVQRYFLSSKHTHDTKTEEHSDMKNTTVIVNGMECKHCKANVENNLIKIDGVEKVEADIKTMTVKISGDEINLDEIKSTVESLGYKFKGETPQQ